VLLVAGGQLDPNIGALLRRVLQRDLPFRDLLVGPDLVPRITVDLTSGVLTLNGEEIAPVGCFIRHDVFLYQQTASSVDHDAALNWFYTLRGWSMSQPGIRVFNRHSYLSENNKIENLLLAKCVGLDIPRTIVTNEFEAVQSNIEKWIQKPVAGGAYTTSLSDFLATDDPKMKSYPRFVQQVMERPELRIYVVGRNLFGFRLLSPDLDYRTAHNVTLEPTDVPLSIGKCLIALCSKLGIDFGAADFMQDSEGVLQFLEINSQPMFARFDHIVGGKLSDAIIDHLLFLRVDGEPSMPLI
jgi:hypothetical protein